MADAARIRLAEPTDRGRIVELWLDLIRHHRQLDPHYPAVPGIRGLLQREVDRGLADRSCRIGVAEADGELVGFSFAELEAARERLAGGLAVCWIHELYVELGWRRRGVARALVALVEDFIRREGEARVVVRVERVNAEALRFWSKSGFRQRAVLLEREYES